MEVGTNTGPFLSRTCRFGVIAFRVPRFGSAGEGSPSLSMQQVSGFWGQGLRILDSGAGAVGLNVRTIPIGSIVVPYWGGGGVPYRTPNIELLWSLWVKRCLAFRRSQPSEPTRQSIGPEVDSASLMLTTKPCTLPLNPKTLSPKTT